MFRLYMFRIKKTNSGICSEVSSQTDIANYVFTPQSSQSADIALCPIDGSMNKVKIIIHSEIK